MEQNGNEQFGQNGLLFNYIFSTQNIQTHTLVTSSSPSLVQDIGLYAQFPQNPQASQPSVDTEYNLLQYKEAGG
jgi:hypothetical protein